MEFALGTSLTGFPRATGTPNQGLWKQIWGLAESPRRHAKAKLPPVEDVDEDGIWAMGCGEVYVPEFWSVNLVQAK